MSKPYGMKIPLPSRATAPDHCVECDGPREDHDDPRCLDCTDATLLQRIEWRYQNGEGVVDLFDSEHWTVAREFHPLHWGFGIAVEFGHDDFGAHVVLGPWTLAARWQR